MNFCTNAASGWNPNSRNSSAGFNPSSLDISALLHENAQAGLSDLDLWLKGVELYQNASRPAMPSPMPVIWENGATYVRDYSSIQSDTVVIAVPSLINRADVLDLLSQNSFMRALGMQQSAWLVDWGAPADTEKQFALDDYINRLLQIIEAARMKYKRVVLLGYCMGGLLALAAAQQAKPDGLVLMATPWDFYAYAMPVRLGLANMSAGYAPWLQQGNALTVDMLQTLFALMQPMAVFEKFKQVGKSGIEETFIAAEDWLNDGVELPARVAQTCLFDWFQNNNTYRGDWRFNGVPIIPDEVKCPALVMLPENDLIVPLASAAPLADFLPNTRTLKVPFGHIGMIISRRAQQHVWPAIHSWLRA